MFCLTAYITVCGGLGVAKMLKVKTPLATRNDIYTFQGVMDIILWQYVIWEVDSSCLWCALYRSQYDTGPYMV